MRIVESKTDRINQVPVPHNIQGDASPWDELMVALLSIASIPSEKYITAELSRDSILIMYYLKEKKTI